MIEMKRVRLINWHNFVNDTIDFGQITYMVGVNAVGKTTILDAIRYCLTTNKTFNALGNKRSGRTLQGSVHGKQREENTYTRPGHTVSYVGIEFLDQSRKASFVITVRVESESPELETKQLRQTWYISPLGCRLEDLPYVDELTGQPASRERFAPRQGKMPPLDRQSEARDKICQRLGLGLPGSKLAKDFGETFPMGTSVEEISDFKTFIYQYILPQPEIDLDFMQQDEEELENLSAVLLQAQERARLLKEIVDAGAKARQLEHDALANRGFVVYADHREMAGREEEILQQLERCNLQIEALQEKYKSAEADKEEAKAELEKALIEGNSDLEQKLEGMKDYYRQLKKELNEAERRFRSFQQVCDDIQQLQTRVQPLGLALPEELLPESIQEMPQRRQSELEASLRAHLKQMEQALDDLRTQTIVDCAEKKKMLEALYQKIRILQAGDLPYPDGGCAQQVRDTINEALVQQGMEPDARIVCELLYMIDESWQSCAEACLGGRRFDIIVSPEHYRTAKHACEKLGQQVRAVSLLDSGALQRSLSEQNRPLPGSLAEKVKSENQLVDAYVADHLGKIICCDTSDQLEQYPNSATRDLLRHYPYRLARLRTPQLFIGQDARRRQLDEATQKAEELRIQLRRLEKTRQEHTDLCTLCQQKLNDRELSALIGGWDSRAMFDKKTADCLAMGEEIETCENDPMLLASRQRKELLRKDAKDMENAGLAVRDQLNREKDAAAGYQDKQEKAIADADIARAAWEQYAADNPLYQQEIEDKYDKALQTRTPEQIARAQRNTQEKADKAFENYRQESLLPLQKDYNEIYSCDFRLGLEDIALYQSPYDDLIRIELEKTRANLEKAKQRCKDRFRQDVLFRLRGGIDEAQRLFRELNRIMGKLSYGEETYRFAIGPSENAELNEFYQLIVHSANQQLPEEGTLDALAYQPNAVYESQLDELMEHIMADLRSAAEARQQGKKVDSIELSRYVDYRQYLNCDIEITNSVTGKTTRLSRVSGDSSGGENQAPFYIAICASLLKVYQKTENSIRLVLLDEAFSKMTSDRIRPMMMMFRKMDLQVVMITTVEKASAIQPFCDITHSIVKKGTRNAICPFYQEEA